jgi:NAD(P)H-dependent FMN reductase
LFCPQLAAAWSCQRRLCVVELASEFLRRVDIPAAGCYVRAMSEPALNVLAVVGSLQRTSITRVVIHHVAEKMRREGCAVDILDFLKEPLALYNPDTAHDLPGYVELQARVDRADVILLGTPDYHGSLSGAMKNFLDHFWHEFAGKLFATIVASHEKGLTVTDQLRTVARQCYSWTLPYGVAFTEEVDVKDGQIVSQTLQQRLTMLTRDARVYGSVLARQRSADLSASDPGFMARHRPKQT